MSDPLVTKALLQDVWIHIGGAVTFATGFLDLEFLGQKLNHDLDVAFMIAGIAVFGVKIINGSSAVLRSAVQEVVSQTKTEVSQPPLDKPL